MPQLGSQPMHNRIATAFVALQLRDQAILLSLGCTQQFQEWLATWLAAAGFATAAWCNFATTAWPAPQADSTPHVGAPQPLPQAGADSHPQLGAAPQPPPQAGADSHPQLGSAAQPPQAFSTPQLGSAAQPVSQQVLSQPQPFRPSSLSSKPPAKLGYTASAEYQRSNKYVPFHRVTTPKR